MASEEGDLQDEAYAQYVETSQNWLMQGRTRLLEALLHRHASPGRPMQILDIGAGAGQNIPTLARWGDVDVVEINPLGRESIQRYAEVRTLFDQPVPFELPRSYDVISALDVIEHLADDGEAVRWIAESLVPGGAFICTVPAYQWMFGPHDVALGHYRRYTAKGLTRLLSPALDVRTSGYFNTTLFPAAAAARLAWSSRKRPEEQSGQKQSSQLPKVADRIFRRVLSVEAGLIRRGVRLPLGWSVVAVAVRR